MRLGLTTKSEMRRIAFGLCVMGAAGLASGQSLFEMPATNPDTADASQTIRGYSMIFVEPPSPTEYSLHDLLTIIVVENSRVRSESSLETAKDYSSAGRVSNLPSLEELIKDWALKEGIGDPIQAKVALENDYLGEGDYERRDRITMSLSAMVIDVKPNGNLVIEARKEITTDNEVRLMILTGVCRSLDITAGNTVLSTQLADLRFEFRNSGDLRDSSTKGWIPRVLDTIFAY